MSLAREYEEENQSIHAAEPYHFIQEKRNTLGKVTVQNPRDECDELGQREKQQINVNGCKGAEETHQNILEDGGAHLIEIGELFEPGVELAGLLACGQNGLIVFRHPTLDASEAVAKRKTVFHMAEQGGNCSLGGAVRSVVARHVQRLNQGNTGSNRSAKLMVKFGAALELADCDDHLARVRMMNAKRKRNFLLLDSFKMGSFCFFVLGAGAA